MLKILSIGNSFSQDAQTRFYDLATSAGFELRTVNLYIGGCSLERHYNNMMSETSETHGLCDYTIQENGKMTTVKTTLKAGLLMDDWDIITLQQVSGLSGEPETYNPYLEELSAYVKKLCPNAKQYIHQTWAYEKGSGHGDFPKYDCDQDKMHAALVDAYAKAADCIGAAGIIPCGEIIAELRKYDAFDVEKGGESLCRDGFHMNLVYGRYANAATWFECLLGGNIYDAPYLPESTIKDAEGKTVWLDGFCEKIELIKKVVHEHFAKQ